MIGAAAVLVLREATAEHLTVALPELGCLHAESRRHPVDLLAGVALELRHHLRGQAYGVGAQILLDLGVRDMIIMSSTRPNPTALEGYGLRIVGWRDMDGEDQS